VRLEEVRKLHQRKSREAAGRFLLEGEHLVQELHKAAEHDKRLRDSEIYCTREHIPLAGRFRYHLLNEHLMAQLGETRSPQNIVAVVPLLPPPAPRDGERAVYLHEIQDPGNLGTILRTLAWFGGFRCLLSPGSVDAFNGKAVRASMGAIFHVPVEADVPLASLSIRYDRIACLDLAGQPISDPAFQHADCYIFGNEARGLPHGDLAALGAKGFTIPGTGSIESLNLAAAVNICQYELHRPVVQGITRCP
jgi:TrmH family RNA methyltransferase